MRGFLTIVLVLIGLEVVVSSPLAGLSSAAAYPAALASSWMDASTPLLRPKNSPAASQPSSQAQAAYNPNKPPPGHTTMPRFAH